MSITSASFTARPPSGNPTATATTFGTNILPLDGGTIGVLSNGDATIADTDHTQSDSPSHNDGGAKVHGNAVDVTTLRLNVKVPSPYNCLMLGHNYLTDDVPDPLYGTQYAGVYFDGFIAELDPSSSWALPDGADPSDTAPPADFATTTNGKMIDGHLMEGLGGTADGNAAAAAQGTPYNVASGWLYSTVPVTPGMHAVDLSIFDRADATVDSTVLLDGLRVLRRTASTCVRGTQANSPDVTAPQTTITAGPAGKTTRRKAHFAFISSEAGTFACKLDAKPFRSCDSPKTYRNLKPGKHEFKVRATDTAGNIGATSATRRWTIKT